MKLRIQNLGPVKDATIDLSKKLTVFCGPNGTGKTWAAYVVYELVSGNRTMLNAFLRDKLADLLQLGAVDVEIGPEIVFDHRLKHFESITRNAGKIFPLPVDKRQELFGDFSIASATTFEEFAAGYHQLAWNFSFHYFVTDVTVTKQANSNTIHLSLRDIRNSDKNLSTLGLLLGDRVISALSFHPITRSRILPVERNSIYTFSREILLQRSALLDRLQEGDGEEFSNEELHDFLARQSTRYARAIRYALDEAADLENISRLASTYYDFGRDIETELLQGEVSISADGEVAFSSNKAEGKSFSFQLSSSAVKTISSLIIYLKYQAQPNDLIIIDEPELNLHPDNQILLARLFARMINQGLRLLISTHSDYIVRELNNLIMLAEPEPALKKVAEQFGYRDDEKISRDDIGVYLFHFKEPGDKHATVDSVPVDHNGFEVKTIEDTINRLNAVSEEIYYTMKYGEQVRDEQA